MKRLRATAVPIQLADMRQLVRVGALTDTNTELVGVKDGYCVCCRVIRGSALRVLATKDGELRVFTTVDSALRTLRALAKPLGNVIVRGSERELPALSPRSGQAAAQ
jgi:hypothetical protein